MALKPFADFLGTSEKTISTYLPQKYKNAVKSMAAQTPHSAESASAEKIRKVDKLLAEIAKEAEIAPLAESKRQEIASNIKISINTLRVNE